MTDEIKKEPLAGFEGLFSVEALTLVRASEMFRICLGAKGDVSERAAAE